VSKDLLPAMRLALAIFALSVALLGVPRAVRAQAGPPYFSNDPGTPGNANWEINLAASPTVNRAAASYQLPQIDLNYGLGERIQLTYQVPYVITSGNDQPQHSGWGNGFPGVKWRFLDQGEDGWQASIFPQIETGGSFHSQQNGISVPGPRLLLPLEVTKKIGSFDVDFEVGQYFPRRGDYERILGLVAGRPVTARLELDLEIYDDRPSGPEPRQTTVDVGGRFKLRPGLIALFMAGRSVQGNSTGATEFVGYFGVQILLSHYGLEWNTAE
jgi:hypothetical protein